MNRCLLPLETCAMRCVGSMLAFLVLQMDASAQTLGRPIPPLAQLGTLEVTQPPNVLLNGQPDRLSPGARIRGENNLLRLSATLVGKPLAVRYLREQNGQVHEVWILTAAEARAALP